jgi:hypothetical protein
MIGQQKLKRWKSETTGMGEPKECSEDLIESE